MASLSKRRTSYGFFKKLFTLAIGGALAFWITTIATSLLPIAADYRAAYSNWSMQTVWVASLPMGLLIGCGVSTLLLRFLNRIPTQNPMFKAALLSLIALAVFTILIPVPPGYHGSGDGWYYFFIGLLFNAARFLLLGIVIGYLYQRLYGSAYSSRARNQGR
ncbi:MAG: hypothetical protein ACYC6L_16090 [Anaerolineae bacterium]